MKVKMKIQKVNCQNENNKKFKGQKYTLVKFEIIGST